MARGIVALVFRCTEISGELTPNDEVTAFHQASLEEVTAMPGEAFAVRVLDALHDGRPAARQHDGVNTSWRSCVWCPVSLILMRASGSLIPVSAMVMPPQCRVSGCVSDGVQRCR